MQVAVRANTLARGATPHIISMSWASITEPLQVPVCCRVPDLTLDKSLYARSRTEENIFVYCAQAGEVEINSIENPIKSPIENRIENPIAIVRGVETRSSEHLLAGPGEALSEF
jgi:hypothetical protein